MKHYDAIVIGAGAGGGVAANVLAQAGLKVLILERGRHLTFASTGRDHLRNHRLSQYGHSTGPELEGNPRVFIDETGIAAKLHPHQGGYNNNASGVGSGTLVYGGQAWRFHPLDFRMASTYGVPEGSSLADWPITYEELAPFYERVEQEVGVSGGPPASQMPDRAAYPMPPLPETKKGKRLKEGADQLGWDTQRVPLLINSVPRDGRPACINCQHCVGFACPVDAKNGTQNTMIARALASGNCTLETGAVATRLVVNGDQVIGVRYLLDGIETVVQSTNVFLACGAIESARLMLISGIGGDAVGRNLQGHYYATGAGLMPDPIWDGIGPGATISTIKFNHGNEGVIGGAMMADDFIVLPIVFAKWHRPAHVPAWGQANKDWMKHAYRRFVTVGGPVHEIPNPECRVTLDPSVKDRYGLPVARLSGTTHPETVKTTAFMIERAKEWLVASGAEEVWANPPQLHLSAGQHQAGTCRMGEDRSVSVVDRHGKVHGLRNLFVTDGSVHVTNGGFNPVLTIMALAYRTAQATLVQG